MLEHRESIINGIEIQERNIGKETKYASIVGRHILSGRVAENPKEEGDGYLFAETETGLAIAIIDISLGRSRRSHYSTNPPMDNTLSEIAASGELTGLMTNMPLPSSGIRKPEKDHNSPITESRILAGLKLFLNAFITRGIESDIYLADLLGEVRNHFYPEYLRRPYGSRPILWGYSISVACLDKQKETATIASVGKNFVGKQSPGKEDEFVSVFGNNNQFYSPQKTHNRDGNPVGIKTAIFRWEQAFILATDGINVKKRFPFPPKIVLQQIPSKSLVDNNNEGLYLVVKAPLTSPAK
jgi:hypothetical protein